MIRDFSKLKQGPFDILVIGGGIYGAWTAYDAALRGMKVALIDKGDWASGTSSASTKLIHGGLRYLEQLRLDMVRACLDERRRLTRLAPHMVTPLRFFLPMYEENRVGPLFLKTGLVLYDFLAGKDQPVKPHHSVSRKRILSQYPFLEDEDLERGFTYGDCQMDDFRFTLDVVKGAVTSGAMAVSYARAVQLISKGKQVAGASVEDLLTGECIDVESKIVVNAAGPWAPMIDNVHVMSSFVRLSKGVHLVMPALPTKDAMLLMTRNDNRVFFMVPWYGKTLVGTTDVDYKDDPDKISVTAADVDYLLTESNRYLKDLQWDASSVIGGFSGLRALKNDPGRSASEVSREWSCVEPRPGMMVSVGGKFTSARVDAGKMVDRLMELLERPVLGESPTKTLPLPSTPSGDFKSWKRKARIQNIQAGMDKETAVWSMFRYGKGVNELQRLVRLFPNLGKRLAPALPFCRAEIVHSVTTEMVIHLEDLLLRRVPVMLLSRPDREVVEQAAALATPLLGWSEKTRKKEISATWEKWKKTW